MYAGWIAVGIVLIVLAILLYKSRQPFQYLGNVYKLNEGGSRGELSEECLQHPDYRMCVLSDGTSGVCGLSGMCLADMMQDLREERDNILPYCPAPVFKGSCSRWCKCQKIKGGPGSQDPGCMEECLSWFSPL